MMMGSYRAMITISLLLSWFCISSALDLNIISYNNNGVERLRSGEEMRWLYEEWLVRFDKSHVDNGERERRFEIFKDNLRFIDEHNHPNNNHSYTVGLNEFADLTNEEYQEKYLNKRIHVKANLSLQMGEMQVADYNNNQEVGQLPASVDWRTTGAVGPVINQGECGSCWAWTAASAVEALHHIQTGDLILLSAQQLVDCVSSSSCAGGWVDDALKWIASNRGIDKQEYYPYKRKDGKCNQKAARVVSIDSSRRVISHDEGALQRAVAKQPVGVAMEAKGRSFQLYSGGIFNGQCGARIDHAVLVIGYGTENGQDYWLIKNTYGILWGEDGFARMQRNIAGRQAICGITESSYYPARKQGP